MSIITNSVPSRLAEASGCEQVRTLDDALALVDVVEGNRRRAAIDAVDALGAVHASGVYIDQGHLSARQMVAHLTQSSSAEIARLDKVRRMLLHTEVIEAAWRAGQLPVEAIVVLGRAFANPRTRDRFVRDQDWFVARARRDSHKKFCQRIARWIQLGDLDGPEPPPDPSHERRDVSIVQDHFSDTWHLRGTLSSLQGSAFNQILSAYADAEFQIDWHAAGANGGDVCRADLARTDAQRRADAFMQMATDAVNSDARSVPMKRVHNIVWTQAAFEAMLRRWANASTGPLDPDTFVVRDLDGHVLDPTEAFADALTSSFRRVVANAASVTIDLSREQRLFTGLARLGVELNDDECYWPGCHVPVSRCQIDHLRPAARGGPTIQHNGKPACPTHNRRKEAGYTVTRACDGTITITTPTGDIVR